MGRDVKIPESGKIYSFNEGNYRLWDDNLRAYIEHVKDPAAHGGKPYSGRYIGSLVRGGRGLPSKQSGAGPPCVGCRL